MRRSQNTQLLFSLLLGLACLSGCSQPISLGTVGSPDVLLVPQSNQGKLEVTLFKGAQAKRTTQATTADIGTLVVTVEQAGVNPISKAITNSFVDEQATASFDKLITGPAAVTVSILNPQGVVIGYAKNSTVILSEKVSTLSFTIQLLPNITTVTAGAGGLETNITLQDGLEYYNFGNVGTLAGDTQGYREGTGTWALLNTPNGVTIDSSGNLVVADSLNNRIRKVSIDGAVTILAGSTQGFLDGAGTTARFSNPSGAVSDTNGNIFVADTNNSRIRKITPAGIVTTFAGSSSAGRTDGAGTLASFYLPTDIAIDKSGNLYVADTGNHRIRKISSTGIVSTLAGGNAGYVDALGTEAQFNGPRGVVSDFIGNIYVADTGNNCIRKITPAGEVTTYAGSTNPGYANGSGALFNQPRGIAIDSNSSLYVSDTLNNVIRKVSVNGSVSTIAGQTQSGSLDARGGDAQFNNPGGLAVGPTGKIYVADTLNHRIRSIE